MDSHDAKSKETENYIRKRYGWQIGNSQKTETEGVSQIVNESVFAPTEMVSKRHMSVRGNETAKQMAVQSAIKMSVTKASGPVGIAVEGVDKLKDAAKRYIQDAAKRRAQEKLLDEKNKDTNPSSIWVFLIVAAFFLIVLIPMAPVLVIGTAWQEEQDRTTIVEAAQAELEVYEENIGGKIYKEWYGIDGNWCAMFVSYCADVAGHIDEEIFPKSASVYNMSEWFKENELWEDAGDYIPKAGDIIFFQNGMSHVGIVIGYDEEEEKVITIEGNVDGTEGEVDYPHEWVLEDCSTCDGTGTVYKTCKDCNGDGYIASHKHYDFGNGKVECRIYGCSKCGGSGHKGYTVSKLLCIGSLKNHKYSYDRDYVKGEGEVEKKCSKCYSSGENKGKQSCCSNEDCDYSKFGKWEDYPNGICYTEEKEFHETSRVKECTYDISYEAISGYGLPEYPFIFSDTLSRIDDVVLPEEYYTWERRYLSCG